MNQGRKQQLQAVCAGSLAHCVSLILYTVSPLLCGFLLLDTLTHDDLTQRLSLSVAVAQMWRDIDLMDPDIWHVKHLLTVSSSLALCHCL